MAITRLQNDLLYEFQEEKRMIQAQIKAFEPLSTSLSGSATRRIANNGIIIFGEIICWLFFMTAIATCGLLYKIFPFSILFELEWSHQTNRVGSDDMHILQWTLYGLVGLCGLSFLFTARALARLRRKNTVLHMAGTQIKTLVGQHLQRKAAIDAIEQRHFNALPADGKIGVNEVPNPEYNADEEIARK